MELSCALDHMQRTLRGKYKGGTKYYACSLAWEGGELKYNLLTYSLYLLVLVPPLVLEPKQLRWTVEHGV